MHPSPITPTFPPMASHHTPLLLLSLLSLLLVLAPPSAAQRPKALVLPVRKDSATLQYVARVQQRTPLVPLRLVVDLGGKFLWVDCDDPGYVSSSYRPARCRSAQCSLAGSDSCGTCNSAPRPGCNNDTCGLFPYNPFIKTSTSGEVAADALAVPSTDGSKPGALANVSQFLFGCAPTFLLNGLAAGSKGIVALGRTRIAAPTQLAASFSFDRKFAVCLSGSLSSDGVVFFGDGPYVLQPNVPVSASLTYTPLLTNPKSTAGTFSPGEPSYEYFIGVRSITVGGKAVPVNATLLSIDRDGVGGTKLSTVDPYTVLEPSIYKAVTDAFVEAAAAMNITRVAAVAPFGVCFDGKNIPSTRLGPAVPEIDLVLQGQNAVWRIFGANSMVEARDGVLCLGVVDGGAGARTSVVIGGHQMEDILVQFDLATSRVGFSGTLLGRQTTCANFDFGSTA